MIKTYKIKITKIEHITHDVKSFTTTKPFGIIQYKGTGTFIAGGAGITPFIAILR